MSERIHKYTMQVIIKTCKKEKCLYEAVFVKYTLLPNGITHSVYVLCLKPVCISWLPEFIQLGLIISFGNPASLEAFKILGLQ